jgi:hypothetical protein
LIALPLVVLAVVAVARPRLPPREAWIRQQLRLAERRGRVPPADAKVTHVETAIPFLPTDGWLRLGDGTVVYTVSHSMHWEEPRGLLQSGPLRRWLDKWSLIWPRRHRPTIGDITLLFAPDGRIYVHYGHVCGSLTIGEQLTDCPDLPALLRATTTHGNTVQPWYPLPDVR